jgi:hypothetical protein
MSECYAQGIFKKEAMKVEILKADGKRVVVDAELKDGVYVSPLGSPYVGIVQSTQESLDSK